LTENFEQSTGSPNADKFAPDGSIELDIYQYIELLKISSANRQEINKKNVSNIPADRLEVIRQLDPLAVINSFDDYINWILDSTYSVLNYPEDFWLNLIWGDNEEFLTPIAEGNKIPYQDLYLAAAARWIKDLEKNFNHYDEFFEANKSEKIVVYTAEWN
jgi:hypothetical protein